MTTGVEPRGPAPSGFAFADARPAPASDERTDVRQAVAAAGLTGRRSYVAQSNRDPEPLYGPLHLSTMRGYGPLEAHWAKRSTSKLEPTEVYDSYWHFAAERHRMYLRRLFPSSGALTEDPVLRAHRFTNTYRVADRVSQYLVKEVQYRDDRSQAPAEIFFRTLLFKIFNKVETWELLEERLGPMSWQSVDLSAVERALDEAMATGRRIYSAAYIMPAPRLGHTRKHANHLTLLDRMMREGLAQQVARAGSLEEVYRLLKPWPGLGPFLAFQYAVDLNYSNMLNFDEGDFVVAGPGALDGIAKVFSNTGGVSAEDVIHHMVDVQDAEFERLGISFPGLFGRRLQPIDCQNLFCEIGKYARVAHPHVVGTSGRTRIKQTYSGGGMLPRPFFPKRWRLQVPDCGVETASTRAPAQASLF